MMDSAASCSPPRRKSGRKSWLDNSLVTDSDIAREETLLLTHFTRKPNICFGKVKVGNTRSRKMYVTNPHENDQVVHVEKFPHKDNFGIDLMDFEVPCESTLCLNITWTPENEGGCRQMIHFFVDDSYRLQAVLYGTAELPRRKKVAKRGIMSRSVHKPFSVLHTPNIANLKTYNSTEQQSSVKKSSTNRLMPVNPKFISDQENREPSVKISSVKAEIEGRNRKNEGGSLVSAQISTDLEKIRETEKLDFHETVSCYDDDEVNESVTHVLYGSSPEESRIECSTTIIDRVSEQVFTHRSGYTGKRLSKPNQTDVFVSNIDQWKILEESSKFEIRDQMTETRLHSHVVSKKQKQQPQDRVASPTFSTQAPRRETYLVRKQKRRSWRSQVISSPVKSRSQSVPDFVPSSFSPCSSDDNSVQNATVNIENTMSSPIYTNFILTSSPIEHYQQSGDWNSSSSVFMKSQNINSGQSSKSSVQSTSYKDHTKTSPNSVCEMPHNIIQISPKVLNLVTNRRPSPKSDDAISSDSLNSKNSSASSLEALLTCNVKISANTKNDSSSGANYDFPKSPPSLPEESTPHLNRRSTHVVKEPKVVCGIGQLEQKQLFSSVNGSSAELESFYLNPLGTRTTTTTTTTTTKSSQKVDRNSLSSRVRAAQKAMRCIEQNQKVNAKKLEPLERKRNVLSSIRPNAAIQKKSDPRPKKSYLSPKKPCVAQSRLILSKRGKTVIPKHPMPFASKNIYYDDRWIQKQEWSFTHWFNFILTPVEEYKVRKFVKVDARTLLFNTKQECHLAPSKEVLSFEAYAARRRFNRLRKLACKMFQCGEVVKVVQRLEVEIDSQRLVVRKDRPVHADIGLKQRLLNWILSYNPLWLRIGLEIVFGEVLMIESNTDFLGISKFILTRLVGNPDIASQFAHPTVPHLYSKGYQEALGRHSLKKYLILVFFLDYAKRKRLIEHDPCLFCKDAEIKASRDFLVNIARDFLSGEGDVTRHLSYFGYIVTYVQTPLDEFDYAVTNLAVDLRDGIRLTRAVEILIGKWDLTKSLRVPCISRLQKIHNIEKVLKTLSNHGMSLNLEKGTISPKDIVDGHREKTLALLWRIVTNFQVGILLDVKELEDEIEVLKMSLKREMAIGRLAGFGNKFDQRRSSVDDLVKPESETHHLLFDWCQAVCAHYGLKIENFTVSFSDGRILCYLIHHYYPGLLPLSEIRCDTTTTYLSECESLQQDSDQSFDELALTTRFSPRTGKPIVYETLLENEVENFRIIAKKVSSIGGVPTMLRHDDMSNTIPDEKVVITYVTYLAIRLLEIRHESRAAIVIQLAWRKYLQHKKRRALKIKNNAARVIQHQFRKYVQERPRPSSPHYEMADGVNQFESTDDSTVDHHNLHQSENGQFQHEGFHNNSRIRCGLDTIQEISHAETFVEDRSHCQYSQRDFKPESSLVKDKFDSVVHNLSQDQLDKNWMVDVHVDGYKHVDNGQYKETYQSSRCNESFDNVSTKTAVESILNKTIDYNSKKQNASQVRNTTETNNCYMKNIAKELECSVKDLSSSEGKHSNSNKKSKHEKSLALENINTVCSSKLGFVNGDQNKFQPNSKVTSTTILNRTISLSEVSDNSVASHGMNNSSTGHRLEDSVAGCGLNDSATAHGLNNSVIAYGLKNSAHVLDDSVNGCLLNNSAAARGLDGSVSHCGLDDSAAAHGLDDSAAAHGLNNSIAYGLKNSARVLDDSVNGCLLDDSAFRCGLDDSASRRGLDDSASRRGLDDSAATRGPDDSAATRDLKTNWYKEPEVMSGTKTHPSTSELCENFYTSSSNSENLTVSHQSLIGMEGFHSDVNVNENSNQFDTAVDDQKEKSLDQMDDEEYEVCIKSVPCRNERREMIAEAKPDISFQDEIVNQDEAAAKIQNTFRGYLARRRYLSKKYSAIVIQKWYRSMKETHCVATEYQSKRRAAILLQSLYRMYSQRKQYTRVLSAVHILQAAAKTYLEHQKYSSLRRSTILIQRWYRNLTLCKKQQRLYQQKKHACIQLQATWRGMKECQLQKRRLVSSIVIQKCFRKHYCQSRYFRLRSSAIFIQKLYRSKLESRRLREEFLCHMQEKCFREEKRQNRAAEIIQAAWRGYLARKEFLRLKEATLVLQRHMRAYLIGQSTRCDFVTKRNAVFRLQASVRGYVVRKRFETLTKAVIVLQATFRGCEIRRMLCLKHKSAITIQCQWRGYSEKRNYMAKRRAAVAIQALFRAKKQQQTYLNSRRAAITVQQWYRATCGMRKCYDYYNKLKASTIIIQDRFRAQSIMNKCRYQFLQQKLAAIKIQSHIRGFLEWRWFTKLQQSAVTIQCWYRACRATRNERNSYILLRASVIKLQTCVRHMQQRNRFQKQKNSAIIIQSWYQAIVDMRKDRQSYMQHRAAAIKIQSVFRSYKARRSFIEQRTCVIKLQRRYRAVIRMRDELTDYQAKKAAARDIQQWYRAVTAMRCSRKNYLRTKMAVVKIQSHVRRINQEKMFQKTRNSVVCIQQWYRGYRLLKKNRNDYLCIRRAAIKIQSYFRSWRQRKDFLLRRDSVLYIQRWYCSIANARHLRSRYLTLRSAVIKIQQWYRACAKMKAEKADYHTFRSSTIKLQSTVRMWYARKHFLNLKNSAVSIQRWYRGIRAMVRERESYQTTRMAAIYMQSQFKAYQQRKRFLYQKKSVILIQRNFQLLLARRRLTEMIIKRHQAATCIQSWFRKVLVAKRERSLYNIQCTCCCTVSSMSKVKVYADFWLLRVRTKKLRAVCVIQKYCRQWLLRRHETATKLQCVVRGWLVRKDLARQTSAAIIIQKYFRCFHARKTLIKKKQAILKIQSCLRNYIKRRTEAALTIQRVIKGWLVKKRLRKHHQSAAAAIQSYWRGYKVRCCTKQVITHLRKRLLAVTMKATDDKKLSNRFAAGFDHLMRYKQLSEVLYALVNLEVASRLSPVCCFQLANGNAAPVIYTIIKGCNRSVPHIELIKYGVQILLNLAKYAPTIEAVYNSRPDAIDIILNVMMIFRQKGVVFSKSCILLGIIATDLKEKGKLNLLLSKQFTEKILSMYKLTERKYKCEESRVATRARMVAVKDSAIFYETMSSKIGPDWLLGKQKLRETEEPLKAMTYLVYSLGMQAQIHPQTVAKKTLRR